MRFTIERITEVYLPGSVRRENGAVGEDAEHRKETETQDLKKPPKNRSENRFRWIKKDFRLSFCTERRT